MLVSGMKMPTKIYTQDLLSSKVNHTCVVDNVVDNKYMLPPEKFVK